MILSPLFTKAAATATAIVLAGNVLAFNAAATNQKAPNIRRANSPDVKVMRGLNPEVVNDNTVKFVLDASNLGFFEQISYAAGQWPKSAVFFNGRLKDDARACPYYSLAGHDFRIEQIKTGKMQFNVTIKGTKEEAANAIKTIRQYGCVITDTPGTGEILFKSDKNHPGPRFDR